MLHRQAVAVGDFNNDGEPDIFVGAPPSDNRKTTTNPANTGLVYIHEGTAMGYAPTQAPVSGLDNPAIDAAEQMAAIAVCFAQLSNSRKFGTAF